MVKKKTGAAPSVAPPPTVGGRTAGGCSGCSGRSGIHTYQIGCGGYTPKMGMSDPRNRGQFSFTQATASTAAKKRSKSKDAARPRLDGASKAALDYYNYVQRGASGDGDARGARGADAVLADIPGAEILSLRPGRPATAPAATGARGSGYGGYGGFGGEASRLVSEGGPSGAGGSWVVSQYGDGSTVPLRGGLSDTDLGLSLPYGTLAAEASGVRPSSAARPASRGPSPGLPPIAQRSLSAVGEEEEAGAAGAAAAGPSPRRSFPGASSGRGGDEDSLSPPLAGFEHELSPGGPNSRARSGASTPGLLGPDAPGSRPRSALASGPASGRASHDLQASPSRASHRGPTGSPPSVTTPGQAAGRGAAGTGASAAGTPGLDNESSPTSNVNAPLSVSADTGAAPDTRQGSSAAGRGGRDAGSVSRRSPSGSAAAAAPPGAAGVPPTGRVSSFRRSDDSVLRLLNDGQDGADGEDGGLLQASLRSPALGSTARRTPGGGGAPASQRSPRSSAGMSSVRRAGAAVGGGVAELDDYTDDEGADGDAGGSGFAAERRSGRATYGYSVGADDEGYEEEEEEEDYEEEEGVDVRPWASGTGRTGRVVRGTGADAFYPDGTGRLKGEGSSRAPGGRNVPVQTGKTGYTERRTAPRSYPKPGFSDDDGYSEGPLGGTGAGTGTNFETHLASELVRERRRNEVLAEILSEQQALLMEAAPLYVGSLAHDDLAREKFISGLLPYPLTHPDERKDDLIRLAALQLNSGVSGPDAHNSRLAQARENLVAELRVRIEDLEASLASRAQNVERAERDRGQAEGDLRAAVDRANKLAAVVGQQETLSDALRRELYSARDLLSARDGEIQRLASDKAELEARLKRAEEDRDMATDRAARLGSQMRELEREMDRILSELPILMDPGKAGLSFALPGAAPEGPYAAEASPSRARGGQGAARPEASAVSYAASGAGRERERPAAGPDYDSFGDLSLTNSSTGTDVSQTIEEFRGRIGGLVQAIRQAQMQGGQ